MLLSMKRKLFYLKTQIVPSSKYLVKSSHTRYRNMCQKPETPFKLNNLGIATASGG